MRDDQKVFSFSIEEYRKAWKEVLKELEFADLGGPHVLRHSGARHLVQHENWQLPDLQFRGRWGGLSQDRQQLLADLCDEENNHDVNDDNDDKEEASFRSSRSAISRR